ncbi:hypothetical protein SALBM311S_09023 [Streptomyces alboniger]
MTRPSGNWFVVGASRGMPPGRPSEHGRLHRSRAVARHQGESARGPGVCPHLGAPLRHSPVRCGTLVCTGTALPCGDSPAGTLPRPRRRRTSLGAARPGGRRDPTARPTCPSGRGQRRGRGLHRRRALRAAGRGGQPPRPVARRVVPPVLLRRPDGPVPEPRRGRRRLRRRRLLPGGRAAGGARSAPSSRRPSPARSSCTSPTGRGPHPWWREPTPPLPAAGHARPRTAVVEARSPLRTGPASPWRGGRAPCCAR